MLCRLYLASDILHNSTVPVRNASRYRQLLQTDLPAVFQSFHEALTGAKDAIKREAFKRNTLRVLRVWRDWYLFSEEYLNGLQATFLMEVHAKWRSLCPDQVKVKLPVDIAIVKTLFTIMALGASGCMGMAEWLDESVGMAGYAHRRSGAHMQVDGGCV